ncbi:MAG: hypothetical protein KGJ34_01735 [Patescibacteria group bacterium]|nr:hypothetical protein [Patescibacteria group bacterium]
MSSTGKWVTGIIIVIIIVGLGWWLYASREGMNSGASGEPYQNNASTSPSNAGTLPTSQSNTSDAALNQDTAAIDAQMQGVNSDSANVNQSMNDQPVPQAQY